MKQKELKAKKEYVKMSKNNFEDKIKSFRKAFGSSTLSINVIMNKKGRLKIQSVERVHYAHEDQYNIESEEDDSKELKRIVDYFG